MIDVDVEGSSSQRRSVLTAEAVIYFAYLLLGDDADNITVTVKYTDELDEAGCTIYHDDSDAPIEFLIEINPDNCDNIYRTIAHEMVHVKQFYRGELTATISLSSDGFTIRRTWMGTEWERLDHEDPYFDSPWEIEAHGREVGMYFRWKQR